MLCELGHVASTRDLLRRGLSRHQVERLAARPDVVKVRRGVLACAHLGTLEGFAAGCGAQIDCVSILREKGIWAGEERRSHLRLPPGGHLPPSDESEVSVSDIQGQFGPRVGADDRIRRLTVGGTVRLSRQPDATRTYYDPDGHEVVWHWARLSERTPLRVTTASALAQAMACLPPDDLVAALESALHLRAISRRTFEQFITDAPRRLRAVLAEAEPGAQSGAETHVRLRFRRAGYRVRPQVFVPGVGHVDNLIEDVVALDTDGRAFHAETFDEDRRRDLGTEWIGLRALRIPATYVFTEWDLVSETVARMVRDGLAIRRMYGHG